jgi:hypothetical protein
MTREDAFLIFDRLRADGAIVFCMGRLCGWTVALRGKVVSASREEVIVVSTDLKCGSISLRLDMEDLMIRYAEPREIPMLQGLHERDLTLASLTVSLPLRIRPADLRNRLLDAPPRELLFFIELPREEECPSRTPLG